MDVVDPRYRYMRMGQLRQLVKQGDPAAVAAAQQIHEQMAAKMGDLSRLPEQVDHLMRAPSFDTAAVRKMTDKIANDKAAARAREEAMLREMGSLRRITEVVAAREAAAHERALEAEARERENAIRAEKRERWMLALTLVSTSVAVLALAVGLF